MIDVSCDELTSKLPISPNFFLRVLLFLLSNFSASPFGLLNIGWLATDETFSVLHALSFFPAHLISFGNYIYVRPLNSPPIYHLKLSPTLKALSRRRLGEGWWRQAASKRRLMARRCQQEAHRSLPKLGLRKAQRKQLPSRPPLPTPAAVGSGSPPCSGAGPQPPACLLQSSSSPAASQAASQPAR